jgi:pyridoxal 5'-phosphate synthase pdxT subunit
MSRIGVLALQGDFAAHAAALGQVGAETVEVRRADELASIDGLVVPGGESTTLLNLMADGPWFDALRTFHARGGAILGTCAGAILLARDVLDPVQPSLGLLDVTVRRNAFGRQVDSFETELALAGDAVPLPAVFIRAPRLVRVGAGVEILARLDGEPVLVRQGRILAATFHPELTGDRRLQARFLALVRGSETADADLVEARRATC